MDITPHIARDAQVIQRYGPGRFTISGETYTGSVLVDAARVLPWAQTDLALWTEDVLAPVTATAPPLEILLVGTGAEMLQIPPQIRALLRDHGIGCDPMDTGAACRTYNILLAEGRRVAAVLIAAD